MSYQVLARKWRPRNFATLVGQEHVVRALTHALTEKRLHHAYLFTGTRGVGKTTLARILAKSFNCEMGVTPAPCGRCSSCQEIDAGRFVDLLEVDAATNTRVDEMRQLLENAVYAPTRGRYKVYVIDEVHMLSNSAFNAMLKTLEEPPEHVKFILATTDPQKIPVTVLSRCLQFNLKQMPPAAIVGHLGRILDAEGIAHEQSALQLISRSAAGSMRDALSLLDQAIAHGAGRVEAEQVREMLGTVDRDFLFGIVESLLCSDACRLLSTADQMGVRSLSFGLALQELANLFTRLQILQLAPGAVGDDEPEKERLLNLARSLSAEWVQLAYQIVLHGREELPLAPDEHAGFVMTLLRLLAFAPGNSEAMPRQPELEAPDRPLTKRVVPAPARLLPLQEKEQGKVSVAVPSWTALLADLPLAAMGRELAQNCELREFGEGMCILRLSPAQRHLLMKAAQDKIQQALSEHFGHAVELVIEVAATESLTPAVAAQRARETRQEQAAVAIEQDGFVRDLIETCDAALIQSSIKPNV